MKSYYIRVVIVDRFETVQSFFQTVLDDDRMDGGHEPVVRLKPYGPIVVEIRIEMVYAGTLENTKLPTAV